MDDHMKVMSVLKLIPRKLGSFEEYTIALSRSLTAQGCQSVLVFEQAPPDCLRPEYVSAGAVLETKPFEPFGRASASALRRLIRRHRPDVVHFHFVPILSFDVVTAALTPGIRVVFSEHSSETAKHRSALKLNLFRGGKRSFAFLVDRIITPSDHVRRRFLCLGLNPDKVVTIHNGVDLEMFRNPPLTNDLRAKYGFGSRTVLVASVGQLIPEKGIGDLIDAAALALKRGADVGFILVGDGRCAAEYLTRAQCLGLERRVIFTGLVNLPEISAILHQCDIFTSPCTWDEAFSLAILEAMAAGRPAIVTCMGGNTEAVEHERNGLVIPPHDPGALADAIVRLHDHPDERREMGREGTARSSYFSLTRWVDETICVYRSLL